MYWQIDLPNMDGHLMSALACLLVQWRKLSLTDTTAAATKRTAIMLCL